MNIDIFASFIFENLDKNAIDFIICACQMIANLFVPMLNISFFPQVLNLRIILLYI